MTRRPPSFRGYGAGVAETQQRRPTLSDVQAWLNREPSLEELCDRYPEDWDRVRRRILTASEGGSDGMRALIATQERRPSPGRDHQSPASARIAELVQRRMIHEALRSMSDRRESGVAEGAIRFGKWSGRLLQSVLLRGGLDRKPVRLAAYRIAWALAPQRDRLMPLARSRGIYCFYSRRFVRELARLIAGREAHEIAAGDGTLTRFLLDAGATVRASDDHSWARRIDYPDLVERSDARTALRKHSPRVVICSWPPAGNAFERAVFDSESVETYVVVTSADEREAGAWDMYRSQTTFEMTDDRALRRLVLPEGRNRVLVFTRRTASSRR